MKNTFLFRFFSFPVFLFFLTAALYAQNTAGGHRGNITALIHKGNSVISSDEDGFIVIWDIGQRAASVRFQLTTYRIQTVAAHPVRDEICVVETGGVGNYRVSAWNYALKQRLFSVFSKEPVVFINYSAGGNFIIASGLNGPLSLLDSSTGQIISSPNIPPGNVSFGITGRAERNMLIYQSEHQDYSQRAGYTGQILYVDFETGSVTGRFQAPGNMSNPVILGNNRFLAGIRADDLLLVDAASGEIFDTVANIGRNALLCPADDGFYCLRQRGSTSSLYRYAVDTSGKLIVRQEQTLSFGSDGPADLIAHNGSVVFASSTGNVLLLAQQNRIIPMKYTFQRRVTEIAAGNSSLAFLTEDGSLGFIPLDYRLIQRSASFTVTQKDGYSRITALSLSGEDRFILWQSDNTQLAPQLINLNQYTNGDSLDFLAGRFPLLSISAFNNKLLALDTGGNVTIRTTDNLSSASIFSEADFTFSSVRTIDGTLINDEYFILCRSVINNNSPFLLVNYRTSETVPVSYPAQAGITVYAGLSGNVYAGAVERDSDGIKTTVLRLPQISSASVRNGAARVFEYRGEATHLSIAESQGNIAIACGSEGAQILANETINMERTEGLPVKLSGYEWFFLSLDSEGNIAWHDSTTGKLLAVFRLYENRWTLSSGREISGRLNQRP